ncbi:MAG TPA: hypothetical protein VL359_16165 [bacterium]|nr:hypothetical protein [bacterium]
MRVELKMRVSMLFTVAASVMPANPAIIAACTNCSTIMGRTGMPAMLAPVGLSPMAYT